MATYNGYKNWNQWNVSLWINNDEELYLSALSYVRTAGNKDRAARAFHYALTSSDYGIKRTHTPDGARFSIAAIRAAIADME